VAHPINIYLSANTKLRDKPMTKVIYAPILLLLSFSAFACKCPPVKALEDQLAQYSNEGNRILVIAQAKKVETTNDKARTQITEFKVIEALNKQLSPTFTTRVRTRRALCGIEFEEGKQYLVDAKKISENNYLTSQCTYSQKADNKKAKALIEQARRLFHE